jgi:hypothetical protein
VEIIRGEILGIPMQSGRGTSTSLPKDSSTSLIRCDREQKSPPMAYVEEEIPEEPITVLLDSLLYTVLDPQDHPSTSLPSFSIECAMEGVTCIIQEENILADRPFEPPLPTSALV